MGCDALALDTILSAMFCFVDRWTPALSRNHSRDLLRFLLCRMYDQSRGHLMHAQVTLAQGTLARKLGLSRTWTQVLVSRLQEAGWIEYTAPFIDTGMRSSCTFRIGRQLKRLVVMLGKARTKKKPVKSAAKSRWEFSPTAVEKKAILIRQKEAQLPTEATLLKIPLLKRWLDRGKTEERLSL
jgi:hypothetical protein